MWQMIISTFVGAIFASVPAWWAFFWQLRRNSRTQVYLEAIPALYEAQRLVFLRVQSHINKESISAAEHEEVSKALTPLLGRIGKLYLTASPKTVNAVNDLCKVLTDINDGHFPDPDQPHIFRKMKATESRAQVTRFDKANSKSANLLKNKGRPGTSLPKGKYGEYANFVFTANTCADGKRKHRGAALEKAIAHGA